MNVVTKKWTNGERAKLGLAKIKDRYIQDATSLVLENIENPFIGLSRGGNGLVEEDSNLSTTDLGTLGSGVDHSGTGQPTHEFKPITLALARRVMPSLFAHKVVPTQPMSTPVGVAFAKRTLYKETEGEYQVADTEASWDAVPQYSGFGGGYATGDAATLTADNLNPDHDDYIPGAEIYNVGDSVLVKDGKIVSPFADTGAFSQGKTGAYDSGMGANTLDAEGWEIGSYGESEEWPELVTKIDQKTIRAKDRQLAASFSLQAMDDIMAMHNFDLKMDMINTLQYEVTAQMDRELLQAIKWTAINGDGGAPAKNVNVSAVTDIRQKMALIVNSIMYASNVIAKTTRRGRGNFVVVSPDVASVLQAATPAFTANTAEADPGIILSGAESTEIGTLNNAITVYLDQYARKSYALVGYKGPGIQDGGVVFSPYIMNVVKTAVAQENFQPRVGVMSRYATTTTLLSSGSYYRMLTFSGISGITGVESALGGGW